MQTSKTSYSRPTCARTANHPVAQRIAILFLLLACAYVALAAPPPLPCISAIFISGSRRVAIFNDQPVQVGDRVGAFRIEEITVNGVRYSAAGHSAFAPLAGHH